MEGDFILIGYSSRQSKLYYFDQLSLEFIQIKNFEFGEFKIAAVQQHQSIKLVIFEKLSESETSLYAVTQHNNWLQRYRVVPIGTKQIPFPDEARQMNSEQSSLLTLFYSSSDSIEYLPLCLPTQAEVNDSKMNIIDCVPCSPRNIETLQHQLLINAGQCQIDCSQPNQPFCYTLKYCNDLKDDAMIDLNNDFLIEQANLLHFNLQDLQFVWYQKNVSQLMQEVRGREMCEIPCDILFPQESQLMNRSIVPFQRHYCLIEDLKDKLTVRNYCSKFKGCLECSAFSLCQWMNNECVYRSSSKGEAWQKDAWYFQEHFQCGVPGVCSSSKVNLVEADGELHFRNSTQPIQVQAGELCSWILLENNLLQYIKLQIDVHSPISVDAEVYVCVNDKVHRICQVYQLASVLRGSTIWKFKTNQLTVFLQFKSDSTLDPSQISITYQRRQSQMPPEQVIKTILWVCFCMLLSMMLVVVFKRNLAALVQRTLEMEQNNERNFELVETYHSMDDLMRQEIISKYPYDSSIMLYQQQACPFCLEQYELSDILAQFFCGHLFHFKCLQDWLKNKHGINKCPVCNQRYSESHQFFDRIQSFLQDKQRYQSITSSFVFENTQEDSL